MSQLSDSQLAELKHMLLEQKKDLERHFKQNDQENSLLGETLTDSIGELSSYDNHPADVGTETFERSRDLAINDSLESELDQVNAALQRMKDGTYGICVKSGEEIPFERLQAIPHTAYTVEHTPNRELSNDRPVERSEEPTLNSSHVSDLVCRLLFEKKKITTVLKTRKSLHSTRSTL
ncbi:hypothetical protein E4V51_24065, partial [Paenibacillus sp. 28ISP30-2]|nr:hypothetical protein [Paenibacillus sp. 28ISP30-2]